MSVLHTVLQEELERSERMKAAMQSELDALPKGYTSRKTIRGRRVHYLQKRQGDKIVSRYIPAAQLQDIEGRIERRRQLRAAIREADENIKRLRRVLK